jgi:hypothetical protein
MFYHFISGDDATVALMAKHILSGENLPVFFYRQAFIGSLNGLHLVPGLYVFGPSVLFARLSAIAWSLLFPLGLYVLGRRIFDETTARLALLLSALPPFCLIYWSTVLGHLDVNTFGVVLLLLGLQVLTGATEAFRVRSLLGLGFVGGLACWTSAKTVVFLLPILLLLLIRAPLLLLRRGGLLLIAGFAVGSLPAWLFYATQPDPGAGNLASAHRFLEVGLDLSWERLSEFLVHVPPLVIGTYYWAPDTPLRVAALALCGAIYVAAIVLAGRDAARALRGGMPPRRAWGLWLLLLVLVANYAALYGSSFNAVQEPSRARYLLPAYVPLFLFVGAAISRVARRSRLVAWVGLAFLLGFNVWNNFEFLWPLHPAERARRAVAIGTRETLVQHLRSFRGDALLVDNPYESLIWQFLEARPRTSALTTEIYYPAAIAADAARRVGILATHGAGGVAAQLEALGGTATRTQFGLWWLYEEIRIPARAYRLLPRTGWRVRGEKGAPPTVADGDLSTVWPDRRLEPSEADPLVVDLGAPATLARLVLWPTALTDELVPLEIAGSLDGSTWEVLGIAPEVVGRPAFVVDGRPLFRPRNGWLELVIRPRPVQFLRVRTMQPGPVGVGMVAELFAYELLAGAPGEGLDLDAVLRALRDRRVTRLLADPVVSARVALATKEAVTALPANGVLNNHGFSPPMQVFSRVRLRETDAMMVSVEDAGDLHERLAAAGVRFASEPFGAYVLFQPVGPQPAASRCRPTDWRVAATIPDADGRGARYVVEARLRQPTRIAALRLEHPRVSTRYASVPGVGLSADGRSWRSVDGPRLVPEWAWAGRTLFEISGGATEVAVDGAPGGAVRIELQLPYRGPGAVTAFCVREAPRPE